MEMGGGDLKKKEERGTIKEIDSKRGKVVKNGLAKSVRRG
jgi:hypothetical protein